MKRPNLGLIGIEEEYNCGPQVKNIYNKIIENNILNLKKKNIMVYKDYKPKYT